MEWERGEATPGRVMANLKTAGLRDLLEALVAARCGLGCRRGDDRRGVCVAALGLSGPDDERPGPAGSLPGAGGAAPAAAQSGQRPARAQRRRGPGSRRRTGGGSIWPRCGGRCRLEGPSQPVGDAALPVELPSVDLRPAAVLCALFDEDGEAHVVLTRRSARLAVPHR